MEYIVDLNNDAVSVFLKGDIDIVNAEDFKSETLKIYKANELDFIFDCKDLQFIDSTGLGAFVAIANEMTKKENKITLRSLKSSIKKLFTITRLNEVILIEE